MNGRLLAITSLFVAWMSLTTPPAAFAKTAAHHPTPSVTMHAGAKVAARTATRVVHKSAKTQETVIAIGGSAARGWKDPHDDSYLKRAFQSLSDASNTNYNYDDRTVIGGMPSELNLKLFTSWLDEEHPQVVVISWGLLDNVSRNTPVAELRQSIHDEILECVVSHAVVLVVTPPVVKATATGDHTLFDEYIAAEHEMVTAMDNKNVHWLDVNADMNAYMQAHGETWEKYYGDDWHPNEAGHILGGQLLYEELAKEFGLNAITFTKPE